MSNEPNHDPKSTSQDSSPFARLPKRDGALASVPVPQNENKQDVKMDVPAHIIGSTTPPTLEEKSAPQTQPGLVRVSKGRKLNFGPPLWTIASILSLSVNVILIIVLLALWSNYSALNMGGVTNMGTSLLGGLYTNFEKMDRAHITRIILVEAQIPVKFDLAINQQTSVVLSQDVTIENARVTVSTGRLNITRALTTIVLPQGTVLPIVLNLTVPVDASVPVKLNVNVDIPLNETQLHDPFVGLRDVVQPFYCAINPGALNLDGQPVCK